MRVFNDHLLVEITKSQWATSDEVEEQQDPKASYGVVVGIPKLEDIMYFSNYSWILEQSIFDNDTHERMHKRMETLMGKKIYWEKRAEVGNVLEEGEKTLAIIKLSKVIAVEEK